MELELDLPVDPFEVKERFVELLKTLSTSKETINRTCKYMLENSYVAEDLFNIILKRLRKVSLLSASRIAGR